LTPRGIACAQKQNSRFAHGPISFGVARSRKLKFGVNMDISPCPEVNWLSPFFDDGVMPDG
jgi:hypothetical protein